MEVEKRNSILSEIFRFGTSQERELLYDGELEKASKYRHAREDMICILFNNDVNTFFEKVQRMASLNKPKEGIWKYHSTYFVYNDDVREDLKVFIEYLKENFL